jgi:hypothetical protein
LHKYQQALATGEEHTDESYESNVLYETSHGMNPTQQQLSEACICPRCKSGQAERTLHGSSFTTYVRGYGWMDKSGVHRDMHTHTLENQDPYKQYRQPGEVQQIKETLRKKGKKDSKPQHFVSKVSAQDVAKAVYNNNNNTS